MPSVVYLCIALFTELFNLASRDIPVLVTVSTLVESQASADSTFPWSWIIKTQLFCLTHCTKVLQQVWKQEKSFLHLSWVAVTTQWDFITKCHTALKHHRLARTHHAYTLEKMISYNSLSSRRSVMSNSSEGKILLNILKSLPKRGIWMIRQEGAWGQEKQRKRKLMWSSTKQHGRFSKAKCTRKLKSEHNLHNVLEIQPVTELND